MAVQVQLRRGTTAQHATFVGALGEVTVDTDKDTLVVHDGVTPGGFPLSIGGAETDPIFTASAAFNITTGDIGNWDTAYGWGNHASAGYLTGITGTQVTTALGYTPYDAANPSGYISANQNITLSGDASGSGSTAITVSISAATVTGKALTGYSVGANTALTATDTILAAFGKVQGQINARLTANQTITLSGDATGSGSTAITVTLANSGVTIGTYKSVTVDAKGRVTAGTNPTTLAGYGITDAAPLASPTFTGTVTTATADLLGSVRGNVTAVAASAIDCSTGNFFTKTAAGGLTWTVTNVPASRSYSFILELTNGGTGTQIWFTGTKWPGGTAPTLVASGVDVLGFFTDDGGTTWRGVHLMKDSK